MSIFALARARVAGRNYAGVAARATSGENFSPSSILSSKGSENDYDDTVAVYAGAAFVNVPF